MMRKFTKLTISICVAYLLFVFFSLPTKTPVFAARKGSEWYYNNFTYEDRLNVRLAMDYAIPRQQIIDSVLQGLGTTLATPIEANAIGYDPTVTARDFNVEKALDHMERAFGYRYNDSAKDIEDRRGYFSMVIMAPTSRGDRMEWAALTTRRFQEIGIDVLLKYANWGVAVGVFSPAPENQGFDYMHGGYDAFFIGWTGFINSDVSQWFGKANWPPYGTNLGYIDNAEVDAIINRSLSHLDKAERMKALKEFQVWFHDNLPYFIVLQLADLWALDPDLEGVSFGFDYPNFGNWSHPTANVVTVQTPDRLRNMNPVEVYHHYDQLAGIWNGGFYGSLLTSYPDSPETYYGDLAESWTVSADGLVWTFNLRENIKFSDGSDFNAEDVAFTYDKYLHPTVVNYGGPSRPEYLYLNASHINVIDDYTIEFTLNKLPPYGESLFTLSILSQEEMSQVPHTQWHTHATNIKYAPVGTGPYMMDIENSNATDSFVKMILNPYYDDTKRNAEGWFRNPNRIPVINCKLISTAASAVAALKSGEINIIDSKVALHPYIHEINSSTWGKLETSLGWGHQGFYINQMNPIWGMNPANPRLLYPGDYDEVPSDLAALFFGILCLATVQIIRKRKRSIFR